MKCVEINFQKKLCQMVFIMNKFAVKGVKYKTISPLRDSKSIHYIYKFIKTKFVLAIKSWKDFLSLIPVLMVKSV